MKITTLLFVFFGVCCLSYSTEINEGNQFFCARANVTGLRIANCEAEPCTVKKGELLPVEVDFSFQSPSEAKEVVFQVFIGYWAVPPSFYGSYFASEHDCEKLELSSCPPKAGVQYTLHSNIFVDPQSSDTINGQTSGERRTYWRIIPTRQANSEEEDSFCNFVVRLNFIE